MDPIQVIQKSCRTRLRGTRDSRLRRCCSLLLTFVCAGFVRWTGFPVGFADDIVTVVEPPLSVPVRQAVFSEAPAPRAALQVMREALPEVTPAARMPQYQLHHQDHSEAGDVNSAKLRLIVAVPGRPLLIEATVMIDDRPFRQLREQRVQEITNYVADPAAFRAKLAEQAALAIRQAQTPQLNAASVAELILGLIDGETADAENSAQAGSSESTDTENAEQSPDPDVTTPNINIVEPTRESAATIFDRMDRYMASTGTTPSAEEVRWLLTNWIDGPVLLFLNDHFQRFRSEQQPVFRILDRDRDGMISAEELQQAVHSFEECDLNRNGIVEATEISEAADDPRDHSFQTGTGKLIYRIPELTQANTTLRQLATRYTVANDTTLAVVTRIDLNSDGLLSADELQQLHESPADIRVRIAFSTIQPELSRLTVEGFHEELEPLKQSATAGAASVTLRFPEFLLEFLAVQNSGPTAMVGTDQLSVGAVNDGYGMLPELDPNNDGRFTVRELRQLNNRLMAFDRNMDGQISFDEIQPTFRLCIGLGPTAHLPLAMLREVGSPGETERVAGPEWFQEMDKNRDFDLSRQEFPGTDEQFKLLDLDSDDLISAQEASEAAIP